MADETAKGHDPDTDMQDHAAPAISVLVGKQGEALAWLTYRTRGYNLVNIQAKHRSPSSVVHLSPTKGEIAQLASALQFAMQAERADIYGYLNELYLDANATRAKQPEGSDAWHVVDAACLTIKTIMGVLDQRGATVWPWAWRVKDEPDPDDDGMKRMTLALRQDEATGRWTGAWQDEPETTISLAVPLPDAPAAAPEAPAAPPPADPPRGRKTPKTPKT